MITDKLNAILNSNVQSTDYIISLYVKEHLDQIDTMSITQLAHACYTSKSQISKYVKRLGYANYQEFKEACFSYMYSLQEKTKLLSNAQTLEKDVLQYVQRINQVFEDTMQHIDYEVMGQLLTLIRHAKVISIFSQGNTSTYAHFLQTELQELGIQVFLFHDESLFEQESDLYFILSIQEKTFQNGKNYKSKFLKKQSQTFLFSCVDDQSFQQRMVVPCEDEMYQISVFARFLEILIQAI